MEKTFFTFIIFLLLLIEENMKIVMSLTFLFIVRISLYNSEGWFLQNLFTSSHVIRRPVTLSMIGQNKLIVSSFGKQPLQIFEFT